MSSNSWGVTHSGPSKVSGLEGMTAVGAYAGGHFTLVHTNEFYLPHGIVKATIMMHVCLE